MSRLNTYFLILLILMAIAACTSKTAIKETSTIDTNSNKKLKALIIDGENNHGVFPMTTMMMSDYLKETGLFTIDYARTANTWQGPHYDQEALGIKVEDAPILLEMYPLPNGIKTTSVKDPVPDPNFNPNFAAYDVVISNMGWKASDWPNETKANFEKYMRDGGGLLIVHAANNSWGDWEAFNKMIGLGGWDNRNTQSGPYVYYNDTGERVDDTSEGICGGHGPQHEYVLTTRSPEHPIMKGLPNKWIHTKDELYDRLRGPAENMTVLATAYSSKGFKGTSRHEPMLMAIDYGKGRVFHTAMGHMDYSMECVGFITTFQRGAEWAATGNVTQAIPKDFPNATTTSKRTWTKRK